MVIEHLLRAVILVILVVGSDAYAAAKASKPKARKVIDVAAEMEALYVAGFSPASEAPIDPSKYQMRVSGKVGGKQIVTGAVLVYTFGEAGTVAAGTLPLGTIIKPQFIKSYAGRHYYSVQRTETLPSGRVAQRLVWVDGLYLELVK